MQELLTKIHGILDNVAYKWVGNIAHILALSLNSASVQYHEVQGPQFPFLHNIKDSAPPSRLACVDALTGP